MATGDQSSIKALLKSLLPVQWFAGVSTPILDAILTGVSGLFATVYSLYAYAVLQTRIATATEGWLDLISADYFGPGLPRAASESDASFRARIIANLFMQRTARPAMAAVLTRLTGNAPVIWEPNRPADMALLGVSTCAGGFFGAGRLGSLATPFNALIVAYRPVVAQVATPAGAGYFSVPAYSALGVPVSNSYFGNLAAQQSSISDAAIYAAVNATRPAASVVGVAIRNWVDQAPLTVVDGSANTLTDGTNTVVVPAPAPF